MTVETANYISQLDTTLPTAADLISEGDDHLRLTKAVLKTQFPNFGTTAISASAAEVNYSIGVTSGIQAQINGKANLAGPTFTGVVTLPATTAIGTVTNTEIARLSGVTSAIQAQINAKGAIVGQVWTGAQDFTGSTVTVPTVSVGDSSTAAASTAFVAAQVLSATLPGQAGNAGKFLGTNGAVASWGQVAFSSLSGKPTTLAGYGVVVQSEAAIPMYGGNINCSLGNYFTDTVSASRTLAFDNIPVGAYSCVVEINHVAGEITFPSGTVWPGVAPTLAAGRHLFFFQRAQLGTAGWYASSLTGYSA